MNDKVVQGIAVLLEAVKAQTAATNVQTNLLEDLRNEVKSLNEKVEWITSNTTRLESIEQNVADISMSVQTVEDKAGAVSSDVSSLKERVDEIGLVYDTSIRAVQTLRTAFSGKDLEIMTNGVKALKEWTGSSSATIVYDSNVDSFTHEGFFNKIQGKRDIAVVAFTTDGDVFGGYYNMAMTRQDTNIYDPRVFVFSFESHGRCLTPQMFAVKQRLRDEANVWFDSDCDKGFVLFWVTRVGGFWLGNQSSKSYCNDISEGFERLGDTTLTGKNGTNKGPFHHCTRLVALQLS